MDIIGLNTRIYRTVSFNYVLYVLIINTLPGTRYTTVYTGVRCEAEDYEVQILI